MSLLILHNCNNWIWNHHCRQYVMYDGRQIDAVWKVQEIQTQATNHKFIISLHNTSNKTIY